MSTMNNIRIALENHLATMTPTPPALAWPNVPYTRVPGTSFIQVEFIPVLRRPSVAGPDPEQRVSGLFYLTVCTAESQGAATGMGIVDSLITRFSGSTSIVAASVIVRLDYCEAKMPLHDPPFYAIPVEIGWHAFV